MISRKSLEEYKEIYKKKFGENILDKEDLKQGTNFLTLMKLIYKQMPKNKPNQSQKINESIDMSESLSARVESDYLIISNKEKCAELLKKESLDENDIIDFYISLHIVLEVGLNTLFRHLSLKGIVKPITEAEIIKNLDKVGFINKITMFIYNSTFTFTEPDLSRAGEYHSIIGEVINFSGVRNLLLHGHSISTIFTGDGNKRESVARKAINKDKLNKQIELFKHILEGMKFYIDHLKTTWRPDVIEIFKKEYLDDSFLTVKKT